ncbi:MULTISPECIES: hypothetical protein [Tenacibaculum]|uniref:Uncharacterized protein n=2 Tax=Tenacibaculum TaxID=104267 RepID=A0ABW3JST1_9FLAO
MADPKKEKALQTLSQLSEPVLTRMASLANNKKAIEYFSNPIMFGMVKGFLK